MSFWYEGQHGITFLNGSGVRKNTWTDWHLIPSERPVIANPGVSTNFVEIPGRGTTVDLTTYLTGSVVYGTRSGSWDFIIDHTAIAWNVLLDDMINYMHGQRLAVCLDDIPTVSYEGRFSVDTPKVGENYTTISISYSLDPTPIIASQSLSSTSNWDSFALNEGVDAG